MERGGVVYWRDAHEPLYVQGAVFLAKLQKIREVFWRDACFLAFLTCVDLHKARELFILLGECASEFARQFFTVNGFDAVEEFYGFFDFVGLQRADEVEF